MTNKTDKIYVNVTGNTVQIITYPELLEMTRRV